MPVGYNAFPLDAGDDAASGTQDRVLMVFEHELAGFERITRIVDEGDVARLRRTTDWADEFFDDLPEPAPPAHQLSQLRAHVLGGEAMPVFHGFADRDAIDPDAVAESLGTGTSASPALTPTSMS